jgi:pimeloyl-ACP methyl ester carboxylesterase
MLRTSMMDHMKRRCGWLVVLLAGPLLAQTTVPAGDSGDVFLLHLPGVGGYLSIDKLLTTGLSRGGIRAEVRFYDWTNGDPGMPALGRLQRNKEEARKIAQVIVDHARKRPQSRVIITSHSAGAGLAVWALENLPDDVHVDTLVLLAPALSPKYDLSAALNRVKGRAYSFNSEYDPILGAGTRMFGTIDRVMTSAAGREGFVMPENGDRQQYAKLVQIPYDSSWTSLGNFGDHVGPMMPRFAARVLAPLLLTGELPRPTTQPATEPASSSAK